MPWTAGTLDVDLNAKPDGEAKVRMRQGKRGAGWGAGERIECLTT